MEDEATVTCPYCGQPNTIGLDWGEAARQDYEEDCQVCCQPMQVTYETDGSHLSYVQVDCA